MLPRAAVLVRGRRPADLAGARVRIPDRAPGPGRRPVDVPGHLARVHQAAGPLEPELLPDLPHRDLEGLAVPAAADLPDHRGADPAHAADHGPGPLLPGPHDDGPVRR